MKITKTKLKDCFVITPISHKDERGYFQETYHEIKYSDLLPVNTRFVQDNLSKSKKNVIRGIHFQSKNPQGKLVRVVKGEVFDVAVDLRSDSPTFGDYHSEILNSENFRQIWLPEGFGHAFMTLSNEAILEYKCTDFYNADFEHTIIWNDKELDIKWPNRKPIISAKDSLGLKFTDINKLFEGKGERTSKNTKR